MQRKKEGLNLDLFKKVVDEAVTLGVTEIDFDVIIGDPLLDPRFLDRARYVSDIPQIKEMGFITTLQWLHRFSLDEFFQCRFTWITISTVLSGREKYREFFRVDKYDQMLTNLVALLEENNRRGRPIGIDIQIKPTNEPVSDVLNHPDFQLVNSLSEQNLEALLNQEEYYVDDWVGAVTLPEYLRLKPLAPRAFRPCRHLNEGLLVYSNGKIGVCPCRDYEANSELVVGHVANDSLEHVWNGPKVARLRSDWARKNKVPAICKSCRHYMY